MKVKDYPNWKKLVLNDRAILRCDFKYMAKWQTDSLEESEVILADEGGTMLVLENR